LPTPAQGHGLLDGLLDALLGGLLDGLLDGEGLLSSTQSEVTVAPRYGGSPPGGPTHVHPSAHGVCSAHRSFLTAVHWQLLPLQVGGVMGHGIQLVTSPS
jgi:hypothetical protein